MTDLLRQILSRRSVGPCHLTGPYLTSEELEVLASAAAAAPDHGAVCPLQLVQVPVGAADPILETHGTRTQKPGKSVRLNGNFAV